MFEGLISVIVPIYNTAEYLDRCITSLLSQNYRNLEILLVDDGSTDNSSLICQKYVALDSRVRLLSKTNGGQSSARNLGLDYANGEYIGFVDSDDWVEPSFFSTLQYDLEYYCADISVVDYRITDGFIKKKDNENNSVEQWDASEAIEYFVRQSKTNVAVWNKLYRSQLLKNARFKEGQFYEEYYFQFLALKNAGKVVHNSKILYNYFQRANSTVHIKTPKKEFDNILAFYDSILIINNTFPNELDTCKELLAEHLYFFRASDKFSRKIIDSNSEIFKKIEKIFENENVLHVMEKPLEIVVYSRQFHNKVLSDDEKNKLQLDYRYAYKIENHNLSLAKKIKYLLYYVDLRFSIMRTYLQSLKLKVLSIFLKNVKSGNSKVG